MQKEREDRVEKGVRGMEKAAGEQRPLIIVDKIGKSIIINIKQFLHN